MRVTFQLLQQACRITLFTRPNCKLCTDAKIALSEVWDARRFEYQEVEIMLDEGKAWREFYEFDTPVVSAL